MISHFALGIYWYFVIRFLCMFHGVDFEQKGLTFFYVKSPYAKNTFIRYKNSWQIKIQDEVVPVNIFDAIENMDNSE